ncbi:unnamed protein product [Pieris macdunnoughi]|uniref:Uncharacterized protein n=1 Tax=Pieris macdunnoughi TaxID=345717 RepID=A0A821PL01_9NEOP|nr:unnamed protein product [Pieris macdunnoughi]
MSIITSGFCIIVKIQLISCAPKIGPILFDPLIYESKNFIKSDSQTLKDSDELLNPALRTKSLEETSKPCQGYDYDITQCKYVNDRKICGYNKNKGELKTEEITDTGNGCRIRNGRLECGYLNAPFNGIRRPPPDSETDAGSKEKVTLSDKTLRNSENKSITIAGNESTITDDIDIEIKVKTHASTIKGNTSDITRTTNIVKRTKYCVEKNDRIFCYTVIK